MIEWLKRMLQAWHLGWWDVLFGLLLMAITSAVSLALVSLLLIKLPTTYFHPAHPRGFWIDRHPLIRWGGLLLKNLTGLILVALGFLMALPGVPGQGFLTILLGIVLLDFPGKRRLELKLVSQPRVFRAVNNLRERFAKPPLVLD